MKSRKLAAALALLGVVTLPGIHRFYLGQPRWAIAYMLLAWKTPISRIASAIEALWYLFLDEEEFDRNFNGLEPCGESYGVKAAQGQSGLGMQTIPHLWRQVTHRQPAATIAPETVGAIAEALRQLENLRQDGLITDAEFEQKRRKLLAQID